jgi:hypothetical protein
MYGPIGTPRRTKAQCLAQMRKPHSIGLTHILREGTASPLARSITVCNFDSVPIWYEGSLWQHAPERLDEVFETIDQAH